MYDHKTNSKWLHANGKALAGPLAGSRLKILPSQLVKWKNWKEQNPSSNILLGEKRHGFMGEYKGGQETGEIGISIGRGPESKLYPFRVLKQNTIVNDTLLGRQLVVTFNPETGEANAFSRQIDNQTLQFSATDRNDHGVPMMKDKKTGTVWNRLTGEAIEGPLQGKQLNREVVVSWRIDRWKQIYEKGQIYQ